MPLKGHKFPFRVLPSILSSVNQDSTNVAARNRGMSAVDTFLPIATNRYRALQFNPSEVALSRSYGGCINTAARWLVRVLPVAFLVAYSPIGGHIVCPIGTTASDPGEFSCTTHIVLASFSAGTHIADFTLRNIEELVARRLGHDAR